MVILNDQTNLVEYLRATQRSAEQMPVRYPGSLMTVDTDVTAPAFRGIPRRTG